MNKEIISLQETSANNWEAKYRGNYGNYKIKIKLDRNKVSSFSCSCPSDYYPCKHIAMIKEAIDNHIAEDKKKPTEKTITVGDILKNVSHKELIDYVVRHADYNPEFTDKTLLEFIGKSPSQNAKNYNVILQKALCKIHFDMDDFYEYDDESANIDILDDWFGKAKEFISQKRFIDAIAICKACIEEYSDWMQDIDNDVIEFIDHDYQEKPFELLSEIASSPEVNSNELFEYCISEMSKPKYESSVMFDGFNNLLTELAETQSNGSEFIALQDRLLQNLDDKGSYQAEKIIERKIAYYNKNKQPEAAMKLLSDNMQIETFCRQVVEQKIKQKKYSEAKKLIAGFLYSNQNKNSHRHSEWNELLLAIAQRENDVHVIRQIAFKFIEHYFDPKYYRIYKASFATDEWKGELQNVIKHYQNEGKFFRNSVADILVEEKDTLGLMSYIEKYLSAENMDIYYSHFYKAYPKETLVLFLKAINHYAEKNTGRTYYDYIADLLKKIIKIEGGLEMAAAMIEHYKFRYKNRSAMIQVLNKIKL